MFRTHATRLPYTVYGPTDSIAFMFRARPGPARRAGPGNGATELQGLVCGVYGPLLSTVWCPDNPLVTAPSTLSHRSRHPRTPAHGTLGHSAHGTLGHPLTAPSVIPLTAPSVTPLTAPPQSPRLHPQSRYSLHLLTPRSQAPSILTPRSQHPRTAALTLLTRRRQCGNVGRVSPCENNGHWRLKP